MILCIRKGTTYGRSVHIKPSYWYWSSFLCVHLRFDLVTNNCETHLMKDYPCHCALAKASSSVKTVLSKVSGGGESRVERCITRDPPRLPDLCTCQCLSSVSSNTLLRSPHRALNYGFLDGKSALAWRKLRACLWDGTALADAMAHDSCLSLPRLTEKA